MLNERGHEVPDPTPMAIPLGMRVAETLADQIKRMVRSELSRQAADQGAETFEEADDFDVGDEDELSSPYELSEANFEDMRNGPNDSGASVGKPVGKQAANGNAAAPAAGSPAVGEGGAPAQAGSGTRTDGAGAGP